MNKTIDETKVDTHKVDSPDRIANQSPAPAAQASGSNGAKPKPNKVHQVATDQLKFSQFSIDIYGNKPTAPLLASMTQNGVITPLIATRKNEVISGNNRLGAAKQLNLQTVPVIYTDIEDPLEVREYVLETNRHRERTAEQKIKEFKAYKKIEAAKAKERQKTNSGTPNQLVENLTQADAGKSRDKAAARVGMSGVSLEKGEKVLDAITTMPESEAENAKKLIETLNNKSINAAFKAAKDLGLIQTAQKQKKAAATVEKVVAKEVGVTPVEVAAPEKDLEHEEPGSLDSEDSPKITSHRQAMRTLDDIIEYVEVLNYDNLTDGQRAEWSESIEAFSSALAAAGLMKNR